MTTEAESARRARFPGIAPQAFEHPWDRAALDTLRRSPGIDVLFKKLAALGFERQVRLYFTADSLRLSEMQAPDVHALLVDAACTLDAPMPDLYLWQNPMPNAFAIGMDRYAIVLSSGIVDLMDRDELRAVIGHELGHIKSGHMLYRTIAMSLAMIGMVAARNLPFVNLMTQALMYALYDWYRKSELTADRAGMLVAQDKDVAARVLLKLAGGPTSTLGDVSIAAFLQQADDYEEMDRSLLNVLYKFEMTRFQTHPFPALRAREVVRWSEAAEYATILQGSYARAAGGDERRRCAHCGASVGNPLYRYCPECGGVL